MSPVSQSGWWRSSHLRDRFASTDKVLSANFYRFMGALMKSLENAAMEAINEHTRWRDC
jgi:hypothetical protein